MTPSEIARFLRGRRYAKGCWMARCPSHKERTGSLSITDMGGGRTRLHCFAQCTQDAVLKAAGLSWRDLRPEGGLNPTLQREMREREAWEKLNRQLGLVRWLQAAEPGKRRYWEAAERRVIADMEPLYWSLMPDRERFEKLRRFEASEYHCIRMEYLLRRAKI